MTLRATLAAVLTAAGVLASPGQAMALPGTCEHRGIGHIERHGGKLADDAYHRSNGERITCDWEDEDDHHAPQTATPTTRYVPVPREQEEDDDSWHWGRNKHRWWRND